MLTRRNLIAASASFVGMRVVGNNASAAQTPEGAATYQVDLEELVKALSAANLADAASPSAVAHSFWRMDVG